MANQNTHRWQGDAQNTQEIYSSAVVTGLPSLFDGSSDLQGVGARNRAGQIAGANFLAFLESKGSEVFSGVRSVPEARWSWGSPSRNRSEVAGYLQGEASVYRFDGTKTNFVPNKRIVDNNALIIQINAGKDVVGEDDSCQKQDYRNALQTCLLGGVEQGLNAGQGGQQQSGNGNGVTGRWSFHPQIVACKERPNGN